ncbi:YrdB family protein [Psychroserpens jangbogonensis]|uniref:YrdB family protein n=1 Tax=Psychroserpens jangbogonensis TaxID=1484460 RepID=UPI00053DCB11|nr:YrdB family protein [Psychroserpens jangbogonensis]
MGSHPINLLVRFILEICALISVGVWGWNQTEGWLKFVLAFGIPIILAAIWGIFAVPDDPSRSGKTVIPTRGIVRLIIEFGIFSIAIYSLYNLGLVKLSFAFGVVIIIHYILSYDRIAWLISK